MVHRDYRKEVGLASSKRTVPKFVAAIVMAVVAGVVGYSVTHVVAAAKKHESNAPAAASTTDAGAAPSAAPAD